jgi:exonuclease SbcD
MKILHTADIHLGSNTFGRIDPATGLNTRLLDFKHCFEFMVERGLAEDIDLFLFCGDAYRTADPTPTQQRTFAECLKPIADAGIPMVMIVGNHDHPVSFGKASALDIFGYLQGDVHVFRRPELARIDTKSGPLQLIAMPWPIRSMLLTKDEHRKKKPNEVRDFIEEKYVTFVQQAAGELDPTLPSVLAGHFSVQGANLSGSERTSLIAHEPKFTAGQLAVPPIDYVALGHIHRYQDLNADGDIPVVYCSSLERVTFKERDDQKGFVLIDIDPAQTVRRTTYTFVDTPARRFIDLLLDVRGQVDPTEVLLQAIDEQNIVDAVIRVRYEIEEDQVHQVDTRRLRSALAEAYAIASIERVVEPTERQRRTVVTRDSTVKEAMEQYIAQHDNLASLKNDLMEAALTLEAEYEASKRD